MKSLTSIKTYPSISGVGSNIKKAILVDTIGMIRMRDVDGCGDDCFRGRGLGCHRCHLGWSGKGIIRVGVIDSGSGCGMD